jgi:pectate lyase
LGHFDCTNPVSPADPRAFFRLLSGGSSITTNEPDFSHVGFADTAFSLTGGAGGPVVTVTTGEELNDWSDSNSNVVIQISGTLTVVGMSTHVRANKTIVGLGTDARLQGGGLYLFNSSNIIIRNITIEGSTDDNIGITSGANHVWVDHCTFLDSADGGVDIVKGADFVTISWCKFYYSSPALDHRLVSLVGASDSEGSMDMGKLHVTYHHNWWSSNCDQRMPSVRFGRAHVFNNFYNAPGNLYCCRTRLYAESLIEHNYFLDVGNPWEVFVTGAGGTMGKVLATNNLQLNTTFVGGDDGDGNTVIIVPGTDAVFTPPYAYTPNPATLVPNLVTNCAGAGRGPFAP